MPAVSNLTLLRYCEDVYDALESTSVENEEHGLLWEGKLTELFATVGISNSHYAKVMNTLYELGCAHMIRRGARGVSTLIALKSRPTMEAIERQPSLSQHLTSPSAFDRLSQRVGVVEGRLEGIDFKRWIAATEDRLRKLEAKAAKSK